MKIDGIKLSLEKLEVNNYKSLHSLTISLRKFNVFIGRNNSGKSNLLDCLQFISEITTINPTSAAFAERGDYSHVVFGGNLKEQITLKVWQDINGAQTDYEIILGENGIINERVFDESHNLVLLDRKEPGTVNIFDEGGHSISTIGTNPTVSGLMYIRADPVYQKKSPTLANLVSFLNDWKFYKLNPAALRSALGARRQYDIGKDGSLTPLVLHTLLSEKLSIFKEVEETLRSAIEEIEELQSPLTVDGKAYVAIKEKSFEKPFDYNQLSDGTLILLAHLLAVQSPAKGKLIAVEEPEDYVHPKLLKFLVDTIKASGTQVLLVTQSPYLLDVVSPEDVFIVQKIQGKTRCTSPDKKELVKSLKNFTMGELWASGEFENAK